MLASFLCGEFRRLIPYWLYFYLGSFSYTSHSCFIFRLGGVGGAGLLYWGVSLTHHMLFFLFFVCLFFNLGNFSYRSRAGFVFMRGVSLAHPVLALFFLSREFLLHIPCLLYFSLGSFSYTSHTGFIFIWGVSLTHPMLAFCVGSFSYTSYAGFL